MTEATFRKQTDASIAARVAAEPVLEPCVCGAEDMDVEVNHWTGATLIHCPHCDRSVGALNRSDALRMWNACMESQ